MPSFTKKNTLLSQAADPSKRLNMKKSTRGAFCSIPPLPSEASDSDS
jgi:hypothetical protein